MRLLAFSALEWIAKQGRLGVLLTEDVSMLAKKAPMPKLAPLRTMLFGAAIAFAVYVWPTPSLPEYTNTKSVQHAVQRVQHTVQPGETLWRIAEGRVQAIETIVERNKGAYPAIALDTKAVDSGAVLAKADGIPGDEIKPGWQLTLSEERAAYSSFHYQQKQPQQLAYTLALSVLAAGACIARPKRKPEQKPEETPLERALELYLGREDTRLRRWTLQSIEQETGISRQMLYSSLEQRGLAKRSEYNSFLRQANMQEATRLRKENTSVATISEQLGIAKSTVYRYLRQ